MLLPKRIIRRRQKQPHYTFNGVSVFPLQSFTRGILMEANKGDWNKLTTFLAENYINIYCTSESFHNFADETLATGHVDNFIKYVSGFTERFKAEMYNLLPNGDLSIVEIEN